MGSGFEKFLNAGGIGGAISEIVNTAVFWVGDTIPEMAILVFGLLLAIFFGSFGYKYVKLFSTVIMGIMGYVIGSEVLFYIIKDNSIWEISEYAPYLFGASALVLFAFLAYEKFAYALFLVSAFIGFLIGYFIFPNYFLAAAVSLVVAMLTMGFVRVGFVILSSVSAGFFFIGMISAMAPDVKLLSLSEGIVGKLLAVIATLIFVVIQLQLSRPDALKARGGSKRVKIRRVFDTW